MVICLAFAVTGCQPTQQTEEQESVAVQISQKGLNGSCPYLTQDHEGNIVLCWVQAQDTIGNYLLTYAVSKDGGENFSLPRAIPASAGVYPHDENLSKLIFKKNGEMLAMFAVSNPNPENSYAGLVFYTQSFDGGATWTSARQLAENAESSIDERYFDVALLPDGEVGAIWLDSRKTSTKEGSSLYFSSTQGRNGFVSEKVIDQQLCQCCRTDLYVDEQDRLHVAYRAILNDSIRDMMHMYSADNGKTFSERARISEDNWSINGCPHTGPALASNQQGMHFAWYTMGGGSGVFYSHKREGAAFTPREAVSNLPSAKHPQMVSYGGGKLAIVWDERVQQAEKFGNRIGLQLRDQQGQFISSSRLTPDSLRAIYPVVLPIDQENLLVAYTLKEDSGSQVWWKKVLVK